MRILYVANVRVPSTRAHSLQISKTIEALLALNLQLKLVIPKRGKSLNCSLKDFYGLKTEVLKEEITCLDLMPLTNGILSFLKPFSFQIASWSFRFNLWRKYLRKENFDLVYSRDLLALSLFKLRGWKCFYEIHDFPQTYWGKIFLKINIKFCSGIVCISENLKKELQGIFDEKEILVAPDGVDVDLYQENSSQKSNFKKTLFDKDKLAVVYTGGLYEWKGVETLIKAAKFLSKKFKIYLIGEGPLWEEFKTMCVKEAACEKVEFLGRIENKIIHKYQIGADINILPNSKKYKISSHYTSPLKLFEYLATGNPLLASDLPSMREVLDEKCAYFFEADNPEDLAKKIEKISEIKEVEKERIRKEACLRAKQNSWQVRAKKLKTLLERSIKN